MFSRPHRVRLLDLGIDRADLRYFDGGHFVLDEYADMIAEAIVETFSRQGTIARGER